MIRHAATRSDVPHGCSECWICGHNMQNVVRDGLGVQEDFFFTVVTGVMHRKTDICVNFSWNNAKNMVGKSNKVLPLRDKC